MTEPPPIPTTPAITEISSDPFGKELAASAGIFAVYLLLAWTAAKMNWLLNDRVIGLIPFITIAFGLTIVVVFSAIAWPFRRLAGKIPLIGKHLYDWKEPEPEGLLACALCSGMWIGSILAALGVVVFPVNNMLDLIFHGLLSAGATWLLYGITYKLGIN